MQHSVGRFIKKLFDDVYGKVAAFEVQWVLSSTMEA